MLFFLVRRILLAAGGIVLVGANGVHAGVIFSLDTNPPLLASGVPDPEGLSFATSVSDNTRPVFGTAKDILGRPDAKGGIVPGIVDFRGATTVGFGSALVSGSGVDVKVFVTQLDPTEGFDLYAGPAASTLTLLGNFPGPASTVGPHSPLIINIDFNDVIPPAGSRYLRFVNNTPISTFTFGTDFDAVGANAAPAVPEPGSLTLLGAGLLGLAAHRRRCA